MKLTCHPLSHFGEACLLIILFLRLDSYIQREIHIDIPLLERADADAGAGGLEGEQMDEERWSSGGRVDFFRKEGGR